MLTLIGLLLSLTLAGGDAFDDRLLAARAALDGGRLDEAERLYRQLVDLYPQQVPSYQGLAEVLAARGRGGEAVDLLLRVGRELLKVSRGDDAEAPLQLAIRLDPESADAHALLGRALAEGRRYMAATAALRRAVALGSTELPTLLYLAAAYWETKNLTAAEAAYRRALAIHAGHPQALFHYGQFLLWQGRPNEAATMLEEAAGHRGDAEILLHLARARAEIGDRDGAVEAYEQVLRLDPDHRTARSGLELLRARRVDASPFSPIESEFGNGHVVLTAVAREAGLRFRHDPGTSAARHLPETMGAGLAWLDYDGDGWRDLYLVQSGPFPGDGSPAAASQLYRNRGVGADGRVTFENVTERAGAGDRSYGQGALAADFDGDGDDDLFLTNYGPDVYLRNRGDGTFEDAGAEAGLGLGGWSSSAALADADADGDLDLYVTGYVDYALDHGHRCGDPEGEPDYCNVLLFPGADDAFFRQRADGTFEEVTLASGFGHPAGHGLGVVFTDLDGDGRPDVYVANDLDPNRVYLNRGDGTFDDVSLASGAAYDREGKAEAGMGVAVGDTDAGDTEGSDTDAGDTEGIGRPEIAVTNFDTETNTLYRNLGNGQFDDVSAASGFGLPSFNLLGFGLVLRDLDLDGDLDAYVANGHVFERPTRDTVERMQRDLLLLGDGRGGFREQLFASGRPRLGRGAAGADYDGDGDVDVAVQNNGDAPELWRNDSPRNGGWLGVELVGGRRNRAAVGARVTLRTDRRQLTRWILAGDSYQSSGDRRLAFGWAEGERVRGLEVVWPSGRVVRIENLPARRYLRLVE